MTPFLYSYDFISTNQNISSFPLDISTWASERSSYSSSPLSPYNWNDRIPSPAPSNLLSSNQYQLSERVHRLLQSPNKDSLFREEFALGSEQHGISSSSPLSPYNWNDRIPSPTPSNLLSSSPYQLSERVHRLLQSPNKDPLFREELAPGTELQDTLPISDKPRHTALLGPLSPIKRKRVVLEQFSEADSLSEPLQRQEKRARAEKKAGHRVWTESEENTLKRLVSEYKEDWATIANKMPGKRQEECRHKWFASIDPSIKKGSWTKEEEKRLQELVELHGEDDWTLIAQKMEGRTNSQCREKWTYNLNPSINEAP